MADPRRVEWFACPKCGVKRPLILNQISDEARREIETRPCRKCKVRGGFRTDVATGMTDFNGPGAVPAAPTDEWPGSAEKMAVMAGRAGRKEQLHHPADARIEHPPARLLALAEMLSRAAMTAG